MRFSARLITLKGLTYAPTGGIVAAPTTSLPERLGGVRNWDYRYCWLRDATLTLRVRCMPAIYEEAQAWREWLLRAVAGSPAELNIMYGFAANGGSLSWTADWLPGYEKFRTGAHRQRRAQPASSSTCSVRSSIPTTRRAAAG